ncbi:MAG: YbaB/EbfC family nucleoid-associated protein [Wolbachia endosymbiont of Tyrophagus putrescentiae]|nr:YbaB/EbfC family nucleoid-associated protein [Wolbachia endosymbiont of Tyrophagus putrescentiae]
MDFSQIMKQAQEMQKKLEEAQKQCIGKELEGVSGGGQVSVVIVIEKIGSYKVKKVNIDLECMRDEEKEVVEDLIVAAFNDAIKKAEEEMSNISSNLAGMMGLPPGIKLPF